MEHTMNDLERFEMSAERQAAWDSYTEMRRFRNFMCILRELDYDDVAAAMTKSEWRDFHYNPHHWFMRASSRQQWAVWQAVERRTAR